MRSMKLTNFAAVERASRDISRIVGRPGLNCGCNCVPGTTWFAGNDSLSLEE